MKTRLRIKTEQQPDASWKAWADGERLVVYAKKKVKAIKIVKMFLEDREEDQSKENDAPH